MSAEGEIVGMVDVLKLTYATLDQVSIPFHALILDADSFTGQQYVYWRQ